MVAITRIRPPQRGQVRTSTENVCRSSSAHDHARERGRVNGNPKWTVASRVLVPAVGPQCAAAVGDVGHPVAGASLRDCLHTLLQIWVDRWGPNPQPLRPNVVFILTDDQRWDTTDNTHSPTGAFIMPVRAPSSPTTGSSSPRRS